MSKLLTRWGRSKSVIAPSCDPGGCKRHLKDSRGSRRGREAVEGVGQSKGPGVDFKSTPGPLAPLPYLRWHPCLSSHTWRKVRRRTAQLHIGLAVLVLGLGVVLAIGPWVLGKLRLLD